MKTEPKGINIQDVVKKVQKGQMNTTNISQANQSPQTTETTVVANEDVPFDDVRSLEEGIKKYTRISDHGMDVRITKEVRKKLDGLKFQSGNKINIKAFANAAIEFAIDKYGDDLVKRFCLED